MVEMPVEFGWVFYSPFLKLRVSTGPISTGPAREAQNLNAVNMYKTPGVKSLKIMQFDHSFSVAMQGNISAIMPQPRRHYTTKWRVLTQKLFAAYSTQPIFPFQAHKTRFGKDRINFIQNPGRL
jgi:hypothetical protein